MLKPVPPKKPRKTDPEPSPTLRVSKYIYKINGNLQLLTDEEISKMIFDSEDNNFNLDYCLEDRINLTDLNVLVAALPEGTTNVVVEIEYVSYSTSGLSVQYTIPKPTQQYQKELQLYKNRFKIYETESVKYQKELVKYEAYVKARKVLRLKKQLKALKGK